MNVCMYACIYTFLDRTINPRQVGGILSLKSPASIRLVVHHVLVGVAGPEVGNPPVVVVTEVSVPAAAQVPDVVRSLLGLEVPVEFPGDERTLGALVPVIERLPRQIVVLPSTQDVLGALVEVVMGVLVPVIVVVLGGVAVCGVGPGGAGPPGLLLASASCLTPGLTDKVPHVVFVGQSALVVHDLIVEVTVVTISPGSDGSMQTGRDRHGPGVSVVEGGGGGGESLGGLVGEGGQGGASSVPTCVQVWDTSRDRGRSQSSIEFRPVGFV